MNPIKYSPIVKFKDAKNCFWILKNNTFVVVYESLFVAVTVPLFHMWKALSPDFGMNSSLQIMYKKIWVTWLKCLTLVRRAWPRLPSTSLPNSFPKSSLTEHIWDQRNVYGWVVDMVPDNDNIPVFYWVVPCPFSCYPSLFKLEKKK